MWQKLNAVDILLLEKARIQLSNAVQLVSSVARSYVDNGDITSSYPRWNSSTSQFYCEAVSDLGSVDVALDIKDLVISISGENRHAEHLVLSGITYPMAFGWMQIKLDTFGFKGELFNDATPYKLEKTLGSDDEMSVFDQQAFDEIAIYYSNADYMLKNVMREFGLDGKICVDPSDINLLLWPDNPEDFYIPGFSIGSRYYPEPYFFIQIKTTEREIIDELEQRAYLWKNKDWLGLLLPAADFISHDQDIEYTKVMNFFGDGLRK